MEIKKTVIQSEEFIIPAILILPDSPKGAVLAVHGYGGCKEELLGLVLRVAQEGLAACVIDQLGHGENEQPLTLSVFEEVETAIGFCRRYGRVAAIGHSSGGRLALHSSADFKIGISPALAGSYGPKTREILDNTRSYRAYEKYAGVNYEIMAKLPAWKPGERQALILYGSRDVPEIMAECAKLAQNTMVVQVENAMHGDIFLLEKTFSIITEQIKKWFEI